MRTIVHAGLHKTGTTSLQAFLAGAEAVLAPLAIDYPPAGRGGLAGHHRLACSLASGRHGGGPNDLFLPERQAFRARLGDLDVDNDSGANALPHVPAHLPEPAKRLLSSEIFCTFDAQELARLQSAEGPIDTFVLYLRGGIDYLYSCWATKVRWGTTISFDAFLADSLALAPATPIVGALAWVEMLVRACGEERLQLRSFEAAAAHPRGLAGDFLAHVLDVGWPDGMAQPPRMNPTPPPAQLELARALALLQGENAAGLFPRLRMAMQGKPEVRENALAACASLTECMRPISIASLGRNRALDDDGVIRIDASPEAARFGQWRFAPDATRSFIPTDVLLQQVTRRPEYRQLLALL
jgi:hypothetical protein